MTINRITVDLWNPHATETDKNKEFVKINLLHVNDTNKADDVYFQLCCRCPRMLVVLVLISIHCHHSQLTCQMLIVIKEQNHELQK
jgi:hypothetical protein